MIRIRVLSNINVRFQGLIMTPCISSSDSAASSTFPMSVMKVDITLPLPFISFGGTSLMTNICSVGLIYGTAVQSIENTEREVRKKRIQAMDGVNPFWQ